MGGWPVPLMLVGAGSDTPDRGEALAALAAEFVEGFGVDTLVVLGAGHPARAACRRVTRTVTLGGARSARPGRRADVAALARRAGAAHALCLGGGTASAAAVAALADAGVAVAVMIDDPADLDGGRAGAAPLRVVGDRARHVVFPSVALASAFAAAVPEGAARATVLDGSGGAADRAFAVLELLDPTLRRVSVVVPNFDYAHYLPARLESVFAQRYPVYETIVLDDASSDDSVRVIERTARSARRRVRLERNARNGGSVFAQWRRGLALAGGELLWIAEADDVARPGFLAASVAALEAGGAVLSFCDSAQIGPRGEPLAASYDYYYRRVDPRLFATGFAMSGAELIRRALGERNVILNASAVLWRRAALQGAFESAGPALESYRLVGDWHLYLEALGPATARVAYVAEPLNVHRRHPASVTRALDAERHVAEVRAMQERARVLVGHDPERETSAAAYLEELETQFGLRAALPRAA